MQPSGQPDQVLPADGNVFVPTRCPVVVVGKGAGQLLLAGNRAAATIQYKVHHRSDDGKFVAAVMLG